MLGSFYFFQKKNLVPAPSLPLPSLQKLATICYSLPLTWKQTFSPLPSLSHQNNLLSLSLCFGLNKGSASVTYAPKMNVNLNRDRSGRRGGGDLNAPETWLERRGSRYRLKYWWHSLLTRTRNRLRRLQQFWWWCAQSLAKHLKYSTSPHCSQTRRALRTF